jgi:hypothetical protein
VFPEEERTKVRAREETEILQRVEREAERERQTERQREEKHSGRGSESNLINDTVFRGVRSRSSAL